MNKCVCFCLCAYVCVYLCVYICVCLSVYLCIYVCASVCLSVCICVSVCLSVCICVCVSERDRDRDRQTDSLLAEALSSMPKALSSIFSITKQQTKDVFRGKRAGEFVDCSFNVQERHCWAAGVSLWPDWAPPRCCPASPSKPRPFL